jgi:hypothetical protein
MSGTGCRVKIIAEALLRHSQSLTIDVEDCYEETVIDESQYFSD